MQSRNLRDLGNGLILRSATSQDAEKLADFNARIHSDNGPEQPDEGVRAWTRDLLEKPHPTFKPEDFTIVEDARSGKIVSSMNLISQTWSYDEISFAVGRPELVGTDPDYRNRGLVRAQFELIHAWSQARGELLQAITGIPYYYRLFGYEMAVNLGGGRVGFNRFVPKLKDGENEPYLVRPAREPDLAFIAGLYQAASPRNLLSCVRDEPIWRYELSGKSPANVNRSVLCVIETPDGDPVGYLAHPPGNWGPCLDATQYEIKPGYPWSLITPSVTRYLFNTGLILATQAGRQADHEGFAYWLGQEHPVYAVLHDSLPRLRKPYAWYVRVADLPGFIRHITPVLEKRLSNSPYQGYTGQIKLTFYRGGLYLELEKGRLVKVESYTPTPVGHAGDAAFPELTFLQLLFGYRSLDELTFAFADCWFENDEVYGLLTALFPRQASNLWPIA